MQGSKEVVDLWVKKAQDDELNVKSILKHRDGTPSVVCFLSQQMAEKYIKAMLIFYLNKLDKVHDLEKLEGMILEIDPGMKEFHREIILLNRFYIETRYVGDYPDFFWNDAEEAYVAAKKIKEFAL